MLSNREKSFYGAAAVERDAIRRIGFQLPFFASFQSFQSPICIRISIDLLFLFHFRHHFQYFAILVDLFFFSSIFLSFSLYLFFVFDSFASFFRILIISVSISKSSLYISLENLNTVKLKCIWKTLVFVVDCCRHRDGSKWANIYAENVWLFESHKCDHI